MSATNRGAIRNERDFYPTPLESFTPLLPFIKGAKAVWEPASGDGRLVKAMQDFGIDAWGSDLCPQRKEDAQADFFLMDWFSVFEMGKWADCIVTNPPFNIAQDFATHALKQVSEVFMLQRINWLGSQKRKAWWQEHQASALFVLSKRPSFTDAGITGKSGTDSCEYAWFYWGKRHRGIFHI